MKADVSSTWRLLKPHALPRLWLFVAVFALGGLAALGERSVFLLVEPTTQALWPQERANGEDGRGASDGSRAAAGSAAAAGAPAPEERAGAVEQGTSELAGADRLAAGDASGAGAWSSSDAGASDAGGSAAGPAGALDFLDGPLARVEALRDRALELVLGEDDPSRDPFHSLLRIALAVVCIAAFTAVTLYAFTWLSRWLALRIVVDLRMRLARHLMGLSMRYHDSRHLGDLLSRISADVNNTLLMLNDAMRELIREPLLAVVSLALAAMAAPKATLMVLVGLPTVVVPVVLLGKRVRKGSTKSLTKLGASVQVLTQMFQGIRTVKAFRAEERELERYREINEEYVHSTMRMVRAIALTGSWTILFTYAGMAAMLVGVGWLSLRTGTFANAGAMAAFFILISNAYNNLKKTTRMWTRVQESVGASERLEAILREPADIVEVPEAVALADLGAGLRFEGVDFRYPSAEEQALTGVELEIRPGETLALVGPSGAGKSTLIDLIARYVDPTSGRITVDGHDLRELTLDSWTSLYALVGQVPFLFHASVEENVRYGKPDATHEEVVAAARAAGIHDFVESLPEGYATNVADMGARLSGGQRQRITIARALLKGAPLLLLDEATSALDTETEALVQEALDRLMAGRTVVVIAHRLSTIREANRIAVMEAGRIVEVGSHDELLARGGMYARLHAAQFQGSGV